MKSSIDNVLSNYIWFQAAQVNHLTENDIFESVDVHQALEELDSVKVIINSTSEMISSVTNLKSISEFNKQFDDGMICICIKIFGWTYAVKS